MGRQVRNCSWYHQRNLLGKTSESVVRIVVAQEYVKTLDFFVCCLFGYHIYAYDKMLEMLAAKMYVVLFDTHGGD